jgi:hypothetical protein
MSAELERRTPVYLHCRPCDHQWIAAWLPMEMGKFARLMKKATCPMCGKTDGVYMSYEPQDPTTTRPEGPRSEEAT